MTNSLKRSAERFEAVFGHQSPDRDKLSKPLRAAVYARMHHAFAETDGRKFKQVKHYFLKSFHPDTSGSVFTQAERHAVFVTLKHIFEGEKLS